jgi:uroporphyrinogen decarboxylase
MMNSYLSVFLNAHQPRYYCNTPPCWFMRQAGRYLPEYREVRKQAGDFLTMCYTPALATEVTLQPIKRYGMDAAIIFSDILVIPHKLGQHVEFVSGYGPKLSPITSLQGVTNLNLDNMVAQLEPVYEAIRQTRQALPADTALIGFAGAPWTLLCYMLDGHGKDKFATARTAIYDKQPLVTALIELLIEAVAAHLIAQVKAGADAVQLFDSWADYIPYTHRELLLHKPHQRIIALFKAACPNTPFVCFPRGIGKAAYETFAQYVQPDGLSVDQFTDITSLDIDTSIVLQGNLDPHQLLADSEGSNAEARRIIEAMAHRPFIFNLGHGMIPAIPPEHLGALINTIRKAS